MPLPTAADGQVGQQSTQAPEVASGLLALMGVLFFLQSWSPLGLLKTGSLFLLDRGMNVQQIGAIEAATLFAPALTNPIMGLLADKLRRRKAVSLVAMILSIALLVLLAIPRIGCAGSFWMLFVLMTTLSCVTLGGTIDAYTLDLLGPGRASEYGRYRLWGSVGWATSAVSTGLVMEHLGFFWNFPAIVGATALMLLLCACFLPRRTLAEERSSAGEAAKPARLGALRRAVCHWRVLVALSEVFLLGFGVGVAEKLIFAYVVHELHGSPSLCGFGVACMSSTNVPLFFLGGRLLRLLGRDAMLVLSLLAHAARTYLYTRLTPATVVCFLPIELLHGITFSLARTASVDFVRAQLPAEWLTTGQQILMVVGPQGVGGGAGALAGGWFMHLHGGRRTYELASCGGGVIACFHVLACVLLRLCGRPTLLSDVRLEPDRAEPLMLGRADET